MDDRPVPPQRVSKRVRPGRLTMVAFTTSALVAGACSGSDASSRSTLATASTSATDASGVLAGEPTTTTLVDDGILRIGVLLPLTGPGAAVGLSMNAAIDVAITQINAAGGVAGRPVQARVADEGADIAMATRGLDDLINADVDAVLGPASSTIAISLLGTTRRNQLLTCSPTASALALDAYPDDGLFFRSIPSDSMQAEAIARAIDLTGRESVGIMYVDDAYGRPFAAMLAEALSERSIVVSESIPYSATTADYSVAAAALAKPGAGVEVVAVIGDSVTGAAAAAAALEATTGGDVPVIVNDAMRGQPAAEAFAQLSSDKLARLQGVAPRALSDNTDFTTLLHSQAPDASGLFAVNAYDCINLIALAAVDAGSTLSRDIAGRIIVVANGGTRCQTFNECVDDLRAGRNIDYDGPSGQFQLAANGDPNRGVFDLFGFGPDGTERAIGSLTVNI